MPGLKSTKTVKQTLEESSDSEEWAVSPQMRIKKIMAAFRRMLLKVLFLIATSTRNRVTNYSQRQALAAEEGARAVPVGRREPTGTKNRKPRRDDLTGIGRPVAPTGKSYPVSREVCNHQLKNETALRATGGKGRHGQPYYLWTCSQCGARWERTLENSAQSAQASRPTGQALVPTGLFATATSAGVSAAALPSPTPDTIEIDSENSHDQ